MMSCLKRSGTKGTSAPLCTHLQYAVWHRSNCLVLEGNAYAYVRSNTRAHITLLILYSIYQHHISSLVFASRYDSHFNIFISLSGHLPTTPQYLPILAPSPGPWNYLAGYKCLALGLSVLLSLTGLASCRRIRLDQK